MKIIQSDNYSRESVADILIAGFYIQYDPTTLEIIGHKGELPAFYNQYDFYYELTDVPVDTLTLTLDAAKKFQEKGLLKLVKSYHRRKFKGKCKQKL